MKKLYNALTTCFVTGFGSGFFPKAPGTVGSLVGVAILLLMCSVIDNSLIPSEQSITWLGVSLGVMGMAGTALSGYYALRIKSKDPKQVVIDEIAGVFATYLTFMLLIKYFPIFVDYCQEKSWDIAPTINYFTGGGNVRFFAGAAQNIIFIYVLPFIFFRLFDILKPYPISLIDKKVKGGLGIMLDDIVAGLFAGILCYATLYLYGNLVYIDLKYC